MQADVALIREPSDRALPESVFPRPGRPAHRPVVRFRSIRIRTTDDVRTARRAGLALSLLDPGQVERLGYPLSFRPRLMVDRLMVPLVRSTFPILPVSDPQAARSPGLEDLVVAMLAIDSLGARRIAKAHRSSIDPVRLLKRILAEDQERRAFEVRLDEFAPGLPKLPGVLPLTRPALDAEDSREFSRGPGTCRRSPSTTPSRSCDGSRPAGAD